MQKQPSFPQALVGDLAMVCLAGAQHGCQADAPEQLDAQEETAAQHASEAGGGQVNWTYEGETGAGNWGELDPSFAVCAEGAQQSPVDLAGPIPAGAGTLEIEWEPAEAHLVDNGHAIQVDVADGSAITLESRRFSLLQFHFHLPSEHTVDGDRFPMEVHFVHQAEEGDLAVIGVFVDMHRRQPSGSPAYLGRHPGIRRAARNPPGTGSAHSSAGGTGLLPLRRLPHHSSVFRSGKLVGDDRADFSLPSAGRRLRGPCHERASRSGAQPTVHSAAAVGSRPDGPVAAAFTPTTAPPPPVST